MTTLLMPDCYVCAHFRGPDEIDGKRGVFCEAFPDGDGIPDEIYKGGAPHDTPYPGDGGIVFAPKEGGEV